MAAVGGWGGKDVAGCSSGRRGISPVLSATEAALLAGMWSASALGSPGGSGVAGRASVRQGSAVPPPSGWGHPSARRGALVATDETLTAPAAG